VTIHAFTDGASRGNPGDSGIGVILKEPSGKEISTVCGYIGTTTNNVAEYTALVTCLRLVKTLPCKSLIVHSDSELMVRQMQGTYKVRDAELRKYFAQAQALLQEASYAFSIRHVVREENRDADRLANRGIDSRIPVRA